MPTAFQWARLKADVKSPLRRGAWYRILKLTPADAILDVRGKPVSVRRGDLQLRSEEHTSELQSLTNLVCRLLLEKKKHKCYFVLWRKVAAYMPEISFLVSF